MGGGRGSSSGQVDPDGLNFAWIGLNWSGLAVVWAETIVKVWVRDGGLNFRLVRSMLGDGGQYGPEKLVWKKAKAGKEGEGVVAEKDKGAADAKSGGGGGVGKAMWGAVLGAVVVSGLGNVAMWMRLDASVGESAVASDKALEKRLADFEAKLAAESKQGKEMESLKEIEARQKKMDERLDQLEAVLLEMAKSLGRIEAKNAGGK